MKVIKKGRKQKGWSKECTCTGNGNGGGGCKAKLLVERDDLFHTYRNYMGRDEDWFITFRCSECEVLTDIPDGQAPFNAQDLPHYKDWCKARGITPKK
jgi:hypothetical protein